MTDRCREIEEFLRLHGLPLDHQQRAHADTCPRCRALLANFEEFISPTEPPVDAKRDEAVAALERFIYEELVSTEAADHELRERKSHWWANMVRRPRPLWIGAGIAAAIVLAVGLRAILVGPGPETREIILRSETTADDRAPTDLTITPLAEGRFMLNWEAVPDAEAYGVCFYGADLSEVTRLDVGGGTSLEVDPKTLPDLIGQEQVWWAVAAYRHGYEIGVSRLIPLAAP